jgi:hypothetical protein
VIGGDVVDLDLADCVEALYEPTDDVDLSARYRGRDLGSGCRDGGFRVPGRSASGRFGLL